MNVYAESSAVLAWLLDEARGSDVRQLLVNAEAVIASDLTLIECDRVLLRAVAVYELTEREAAARRGHLATVATSWHILRISADIVARARQPFPGEPFVLSTPFISRLRSLREPCSRPSKSSHWTSAFEPRPAGLESKSALNEKGRSFERPFACDAAGGRS